MKKILGRSLVILGVVALACVAGSTFAQFGQTTAVQQGNFGLAGDGGQTFSLMVIIKSFINWVLGLLSLIALGMALYGGFKMVTAAGDDGKYKEGFKVLKQAAIGLVVVGLSWIIVSTIFYLINAAGTNQLSSAT